MPANILNLSTCTVTGIEEYGHGFHIRAEAAQPPKTYPHCHSDNLIGFGCREQMVCDCLCTAAGLVSTSTLGASTLCFIYRTAITSNPCIICFACRA
jgi:hypothetical protein